MQRFWTYSRVLASGRPSPGATVQVYTAGTLIPSNIFADNLNPPTPQPNPFTADADGYAFFYAANGRYDVRFSGGTPPDVIDTPYTLGDILLQDLGGAFPAGASQLDLGGSRFVSPDISGDPATVLITNWVDVVFPTWDQLPVGAEVDWVVSCQVPTGASVTAQLFNPDTNETIDDPTPFTDDTQMVEHTIPLLASTPNPNFGGKARMRLIVTSGDGLPGLYAIGCLRFTLPQ